MTELELAQVKGEFVVGRYSRKIYHALLSAIQECERLAYTTKQDVWVYDKKEKICVWNVDGRYS